MGQGWDSNHQRGAKMIAHYTKWVATNPLLSAMIQFAILGTLGEIISFSLKLKKIALPSSWWQLILKMFAWAILGVLIKLAFTGMKGFALALIEHGFLPLSFKEGLGWALTVSVLTNLLFGPQMMAIHRLEDNLITGQKGFSGLQRSWWTLIWFWIPAHTLTFLLPPDLQIGLAALWSLVLGLLLAFMRLETRSGNQEDDKS
jgi:hypothetical protein